MKYTYYGHSCFSVLVNGKTLLFDPFISHNELAKDINVDTIQCDYILVSHGHVDHIADAVSIAKRTGAKVVCSWEIHEWFNKQGVSNTHPMNTGGGRDFDFGRVNCVTAQHSSGLPDGSYGGNPMGFVIQTDKGNFYYSGDTALTWDMKLIPMLYGQLRFAVLPIGDNFTMNYEHALIASEFIECKTIIGVHYDTFGYIVIDKDAAVRAFADKDHDLVLVKIGETKDL